MRHLPVSVSDAARYATTDNGVLLFEFDGLLALGGDEIGVLLLPGEVDGAAWWHRTTARPRFGSMVVAARRRLTRPWRARREATTAVDTGRGRPDAPASAAGLLAVAWTGELHRPPLPVDPVRIAAGLGVDVVPVDLETEVACAVVARPGRDAVVMVNAADSRPWLRLGIAHALGHVVDASNAGSFHYEHVCLRAVVGRAAKNPAERWANDFAAALLLPTSCLAELGEGLPAAALAAACSVPPLLAGYRLALEA